MTKTNAPRLTVARGERHWKATLTNEQARRAHALLMEGHTVPKVAEMLGGVSRCALGMLRSGETWRCLGLGPAYPKDDPRRQAWEREQKGKKA